jgi:outer membrane protein assembly factor BamE (lipoprotein component of BamABCDE complex)
MRAFTRWLVVTLPLVLVGAGPATSEGAGALRATDFAQVVPGKTKDEVRAMLGAPSRTYPARGAQGESWEYRYRGDFDRRSFYVEFGANGTVAKTEDAVDSHAGPYRGP